MSAAPLTARVPAQEGALAVPLNLGGPAALAESAWMGSPQASEVLEPIRPDAPLGCSPCSPSAPSCSHPGLWPR